MGRSSTGILVALAVTLAGCGGADERAGTTRTETLGPAVPADRCVRAAAPGFRLCGQPTGKPRRPASTIQRRDGGTWVVAALAPPGTAVDGIPHGHWREAWLSPDRKLLLAQWSAECEIPIAFFVDLAGHAMRPVTGEKDWTQAPESIALGWSSDGRARVRLTKGYCGGAKHPPGVYLVDPATSTLTLVERDEARG